MIHVQELLKKHQDVSAWRVSETATRSYELFFVHRKLETVRATDTASIHATVYVDHDGFRGDSSFALSPAMTEKDAEEKIEAAVRRAKMVNNPFYELPEKGEMQSELPTNMQDADVKTLGKQIADAVFAADDQEGGSINACEIFLYRDTKRVQNSRWVT